MKPKYKKSFALFLLLALFAVALSGGEKAMADTVLYRASLAGNKNKTVAVKKRGTDLIISLEGLTDNPLELKADGGGTSTCRTIIEHSSSEVTVILSLAIPDTRSRCRTLPSFVSIESSKYNISIDEETVKKIAGNNATVRSSVQKILGKIEEGES